MGGTMTVLMAYDGREHTQKALDYALKYAKSFNERLHIISVFPSKEHLSEMDAIEEKFAQIKKTASEQGVDVVTQVESGHPSTVLLECAQRLNCSAIIVGRAANKTGLDRVVLGSVSNYVVSNAQCIVIVVQ
jgi:nucleotide-binding universal stress UspA family protein